MENAYPKDKQFKFLSEYPLDPSVTKRLTDLLYSTIKGNNNVLMTPMAEDYGPNFLLKKWDAIVEANKDKLIGGLYNYELAERSKFSARSIQKPWSERQGDVISYFKAKRAKVKFNEVLPLVKQFSGALRPLSPTNAVKLLKNTTNSGLPYYEKKGKVKSKIVAEYRDNLKYEYPALLFTRTQENNKTRTVWGYPISDTLLEMQYYAPVLEVQKKKPWRSALLGPEFVDLNVTRLLKEADYNGRYLLSADFSAYDASISPFLSKLAFKCVENMFQGEYSVDINYIRDRFINIPLLTPSGIFRGPHGIPSGSTFTNEIDSIVQYLVVQSSGTVDKECQIQGDDGLYILKGGQEDKFFEACQNAGLNTNPEKTMIDKYDCIYLRNYYSLDYEHKGFIGGIYPTYRALTRLLFQERFVDLNEGFEGKGLSGKDFFSLRSLAILENCKYHPLFKEFCLFVKEYNKYNLDFTQKGVSQYSELLSRQSGTEGFNKYRHGDNIKGVRSFESYKIVFNK